MKLLIIQLAKACQFPWPSARWVGTFVALAALAMIPVVGKALLQNSPRNIPEFINRLPDTNDQEKMRQQRKTEQDFEANNALRKKQVAEETAKLVKLANDLKDEVDKTGKDTLSVSAMRKAEAIEKLARSIKQKMIVLAVPKPS